MAGLGRRRDRALGEGVVDVHQAVLARPGLDQQVRVVHHRGERLRVGQRLIAEVAEAEVDADLCPGRSFFRISWTGQRASRRSGPGRSPAAYNSGGNSSWMMTSSPTAARAWLASRARMVLKAPV